jgi:integrase
MFDRYLACYPHSESRKQNVARALARAADAFGSIAPENLTPGEIQRWRRTLPQGSSWEMTVALRAAFAWAERERLIADNPARRVSNPQPVRGEVRPFADWEEIEAIAEELGPFGIIAIFGAGTGLRPGEWITVERRDLDAKADVPAVNVSRRMTKDGEIVDATKNGKPRRVPLRPKVVDALDHYPVRLDSKLLFPNRSGGFLDLHNWRERQWRPALEGAGFVDEDGKADRGPYALRHTYATWALRAGIPTFTVARRMGTSLQMIEKTYGHLAVDAEEWEVARLTAFDSGRNVDAIEESI